MLPKSTNRRGEPRHRLAGMVMTPSRIKAFIFSAFFFEKHVEGDEVRNFTIPTSGHSLKFIIIHLTPSPLILANLTCSFRWPGKSSSSKA